MSNFTFLVENSSLVQQYPWLSLLYKDAVVTENAYFEENKRRMYREARNVLICAVQYYIQERNITIKSEKKPYKKGDSEKLQRKKKKVDFDSLYNQINAIKPTGLIMVQAHMVRMQGNNAVHDVNYNGNGRELDCLKNLHDVILWIYNDLTGKNIVQEFQIENLGMTSHVAETERFREAIQVEPVKVIKKTKRKKKNKAISIVKRENQIVLKDVSGEDVFAYTPTNIEQESLPAKIVKAETQLCDIRMLQQNVNMQIESCITENQSACTQIQNYIGKLNLNAKNAQVMMEWFTRLQAEQHNLLSDKMAEIDAIITDKDNAISYLRELINEQGEKITYLYDRIDNLIFDIELLHETLKNANIKQEYQWLGQWYINVKSNFENRNFEGGANSQNTYTTEQVRQLFEAFKLKYNKMSFLYESEKIINQKKEEEINCYQVQLENAQRESREKEQALKEHRFHEEMDKRKQSLFRKIAWTVVICLLVLLANMFVYSQWQVKNALAYKEQYDALLDMLSVSDSTQSKDTANEVLDKNDSNSSDSMSVETPAIIQSENEQSLQEVQDILVPEDTIIPETVEPESTIIPETVEPESTIITEMVEPESTIIPETVEPDMPKPTEPSEPTPNVIFTPDNDVFAEIKNERIIVPDSIASISGIHEDMLKEIVTITPKDIEAIEYDQNTTNESPFYLGNAKVYSMHRVGYGGRSCFSANTHMVSLYHNDEHQYVKFAYGTGSKYYETYNYVIAIAVDAFCDGIDSSSTPEDIMKVLGDTAYNTSTNMDDDECNASHFSSSEKITVYTFHLTEGDDVGFVFNEEGKICDYVYLRLADL